LSTAVRNGHFDIVRLLVKHGADINEASIDNITPLGYAQFYEREEIEDYLRSLGAITLPPDIPAPSAILEHIEQHIGSVKPLAMQEIVPGDSLISIYLVPADKKKKRNHLTLFTVGMSQRAMSVPAESEGLETSAYKFGELLIRLPADWPLTQKALADPRHRWPIDWLRKIARYPHEHNTWLGMATIVANEEPPEPLAPSTKLTCILAITERTDFAVARLADGRTVLFYTLVPLYTEERDLEKKKGVEHLLAMFEKHDIDIVVDVKRKNVAIKKK
jgi:ankyrin repeat protein